MPTGFFEFPNSNNDLIKQALALKLKSDSSTNKEIHAVYRSSLSELQLSDPDFQFKFDQLIFGYLVLTITVKNCEDEKCEVEYPMPFTQIAQQCQSDASPIAVDQVKSLVPLLFNTGGLILTGKLSFESEWIDLLALPEESRLLLKSRWQKYENQPFQVEYILIAEPEEVFPSVYEDCYCSVL